MPLIFDAPYLNSIFLDAVDVCVCVCGAIGVVGAMGVVGVVMVVVSLWLLWL